jgi:lipopolysaccharide biosynthesis protein
MRSSFPLLEYNWNQLVNYNNPINILTIKLESSKKYLKGCGYNLYSVNKRKGLELKYELDILDLLEEDQSIPSALYIRKFKFMWS